MALSSEMHISHQPHPICMYACMYVGRYMYTCTEKRKKKNISTEKHEIIETGSDKIDLNEKQTRRGLNTCSLSIKKRDIAQNHCAHRASPQRRQVGLSK